MTVVYCDFCKIRYGLGRDRSLPSVKQFTVVRDLRLVEEEKARIVKKVFWEENRKADTQSSVYRCPALCGR